MDYTGLVEDEPYEADNVVHMHPEKVQVPEQSLVSKSLPRRPMQGFMDVYNSKQEIKWAIDGLLPTAGLMYVGARSGTGKTILAIQLAVDIVLERPTMTFQRGEDLKPQRIGIFSLEMGEAELKQRVKHMYPDLTEEQQKILQDSILIYCNPEPFKLWTVDHYAEFCGMFLAHKLTGAVIDSASVSFAESLKDDKQVNDTIENLYMLRNRLNAWNIVVCHTRKLPAGIVANLEDVTVDEIFGHSGVAQSASSVLLMHHDKKDKSNKDGSKVVWLMNPKNRFAPEFAPFKMHLPTDGRPLQFMRNAIPLPPLTEEQKKAINKQAMESLGDSLTDLDFGSIGGSDE